MGKLAALDPRTRSVAADGLGNGARHRRGREKYNACETMFDLKPFGDLGLVFQNARIAAGAAAKMKTPGRGGRSRPARTRARFLGRGPCGRCCCEPGRQTGSVRRNAHRRCARGHAQQPLDSSRRYGRGGPGPRSPAGPIRLSQPIGQAVVQQPVPEPAIADPAFIHRAETLFCGRG